MLHHFSWKPIFWRAQLIYIWTYYIPCLPLAQNFCYPLTLIIWWKFYAESLASILQLEFEIVKENKFYLNKFSSSTPNSYFSRLGLKKVYSSFVTVHPIW